MFQLVVVVFECALGVVGGINEDALHLPCIEGHKSFQGQQVVSLDQKIVATVPVGLFKFQKVIGNLPGSLFCLIFVNPIQKRHLRSLFENC